MSVSDPAGLTDRIPELEALASIPRIRKAIAAGKPHAVYRALWWTRTLGQAGEHRERVAALLKQRRLFTTPIQSAPILSTINGIGATIYGESDRDTSDGTYVTTHFVVLAFVPVFPLSQYLVQRSPQGKGWRFFGKVPLGPVVSLWRNGLVGFASLGVLGAAWQTWEVSGHNEVVLCNGLDVPVHATLGSQTVDLPPEGRQTVHLDVGEVPMVATANGVPVDSGTFDVERGSSKILIWNIAGMAPVYTADVSYFSSGSGEENADPNLQIHCGEDHVTLRGVDYPFQTPPDSVQMPSSAKRVTRTALNVAKGGWRTCLGVLMDKGNSKEAIAMARPILEVHDLDQDTSSVVYSLLYGGGAKETDVLPLSRAMRDAHPDKMTSHLAYQYVMEHLGQEDAERKEYRAYAAAHPDDPDAQYLYDHLLPADQAIAALRDLAATHASHVYTLGSLCLRELELHRYEPASAACAAYVANDPEHGMSVLEEQVTALVGLHRLDDAVALINAVHPEEPSDRLHRAALYARVVRLQGGEDPESALNELEGNTKSYSAIGRVWGGAELDDTEVAAISGDTYKAGVELYQGALRDPAQALQQVQDDSSGAIGWLDEATWALLFGEAVRTENPVALTALQKTRLVTPADQKLCLAWLQGQDPGPEFQALPLEVRAALAFERARFPGISESERDRLLAEARADEPLPGPVTWAGQRWPR